MPVYRYYLIAESGRLAATRRLHCESDEKAGHAAADALLASSYSLVEVWENYRKVAMIRNEPTGETRGG